MSDLNGKVAVVTGGASGVGRATSVLLAHRGARVVVADVNGEGADDVAATIGDGAVACRADVAREEDVVAMIDLAVTRFGRIDILHNNAALTGAGDLHAWRVDTDLRGMDVEVWDRMMQINLRGPMLGCKHALPYMVDQRAGVIVNTTSVAGDRGQPFRYAYGTSKGALSTLTLYVATGYGRFGVRCNAVAPGVIRTPASSFVSEETMQDMLRHHPATRLSEAEDIARVVAFLCSDESASINGQVIATDGGLACHMPYYADIVERTKEPAFAISDQTGPAAPTARPGSTE
jgi:NAD(P)-dependent dehydrogenase (short-subunit alcohol dehydrogenase family)